MSHGSGTLDPYTMNSYMVYEPQTPLGFIHFVFERYVLTPTPLGVPRLDRVQGLPGWVT